jgi:four helix bundle protein
MGNYRDLVAYKKAFAVAMEIYEVTKKFPPEERYSLTDQIRRSSRAVAACIGEAYRKRRYPAHFVSKTSDGDMENTETQIWLDFSRACKYLSDGQLHDLESKTEEVGKLLNHMMEHPENYAGK